VVSFEINSEINISTSSSSQLAKRQECNELISMVYIWLLMDFSTVAIVACFQLVVYDDNRDRNRVFFYENKILCLIHSISISANCRGVCCKSRRPISYRAVYSISLLWVKIIGLQQFAKTNIVYTNFFKVHRHIDRHNDTDR